ncbi:uncharacterized protein LOC112058457 [Bicyclus anynana]|uniref:Uncharacterized protein LOC112058457 n=1 Tax=Bicyclus anynana TaxID=110368 RepID=A0ABM3LRC6_BICAN|nr:uncharacterized protein LOC112058457 [Bicyclus anynana]
MTQSPTQVKKSDNDIVFFSENDGVDLLIEAIRSVPDIKATKKKVLDSIPVQIEEETTQSILILQRTNIIADEANDTLKSVVAQLKTFDTIDEEEEESEYYQYNKNVHKSNNIKLKETLESEDIIYATTTPFSNIRVAKGENNKEFSKKLYSKKGDNDKGFKLFIEDSDDDDEVTLTTINPPDSIKELVTSQKPIKTTTNLKDEQITLHDANDSYRHQNMIKLDWIEESYNHEDERKEVSRFIETTTQKLAPTHTSSEIVSRTTKKKRAKLNKYDDPTSSISKERIEEDIQITKHLNSEYVMYKKQMDLLNSLDYGTDNIEMEAESLDFKEDKSNSEQFPSYLV